MWSQEWQKVIGNYNIGSTNYALGASYRNKNFDSDLFVVCFGVLPVYTFS